MKIKFFFTIILIFTASLTAEDFNKERARLNKTSGEPSYAKFNINNISTFFKNDGESDINPINYNSGFEFPKGSGKTAVFQSGFLWGGKVDGQVKVGGSVYRQGTVPGKILNSGLPWDQLQAEDPNSINVRIYRVRPDYKTADLSDEIDDKGKTENEIRTAYEKDWNEWPAADGAPFNDINSNGIYESEIDIPGVPGADQTIWFVCNDTDPAQTVFFYGSNPMGIEEQVTIWGYKNNGVLGNTLFRKYKIVNKSDKIFEDMFISMWHDSDVGYAGDDLIGCDTTLNMSYAYNSKDYDRIYENNPAAVGFKLLQGPLVDSPGDYGIFNGNKIINKKNLQITSHFHFVCGLSNNCEPSQGHYESGALNWYKWFQGKYPDSETDFEIPVEAGGGFTHFQLAGDPVTGDGWIDGISIPAGDRKGNFASGPFNMAPGDIQEIIIAEVATLGKDRIDAVKNLRYYSSILSEDFENGYNKLSVIPTPLFEINQSLNNLVVNWNAEVENYSKGGFEFQGYNVYQLEDIYGSIEAAKKIVTFDKADGIKEISGRVINPETGYPMDGVCQHGTDSGIKNSYTISKDFIDDIYFIPGKKYYFAVTAYVFNSNGETNKNVTESLLEIMEITFTGLIPGPDFGDIVDITHAEGGADAKIDVTIIDPFQTTGDEYEVSFGTADYYLNENGDWSEIVIVHDKVNKSNDISPSYLEAMALYGETANSVELYFTLNLISNNNNYASGILLQFPQSVKILEVPLFLENGGNIERDINSSNNTILYGDSNATGTEWFYGGEIIKIIIESFTLPLQINYIIYDAGWNSPLKNAEGVITIESISYALKTEKYWNLKNLTISDTLLKKQVIQTEI